MVVLYIGMFTSTVDISTDPCGILSQCLLVILRVSLVLTYLYTSVGTGGGAFIRG